MCCPEQTRPSWSASIDYKDSISLIRSPPKRPIKILRGAIPPQFGWRGQVAAVNLSRTRADGLLALKVADCALIVSELPAPP
jgi:hypothetical protein